MFQSAGRCNNQPGIIYFAPMSRYHAQCATRHMGSPFFNERPNAMAAVSYDCPLPNARTVSYHSNRYTFDIAPNLHKIHLAHFEIIHISNSILLNELQFPWTQLTEFSCSGCVYLLDIFYILQQFPNLVSCVFKNCMPHRHSTEHTDTDHSNTLNFITSLSPQISVLVPSSIVLHCPPYTLYNSIRLIMSGPRHNSLISSCDHHHVPSGS